MMTALVFIALLQEEARSVWEGFGAGSNVILRITESDRKESYLVRYTVSKVEAEQITVHEEIPGKSRDVTTPLKKDDAMKKVGTENVDVDGKTFACTLYEKTTEDKRGRRTIRQWLCKDLPGRVAKSEIVTKTDTGERKSTGRLARLDQRTQVGTKLLSYAVYEYSERTEDGREGTVVRWVSEQVPGFTIREESRERRAGGSKEFVRVAELVDFEVK